MTLSPEQEDIGILCWNPLKPTRYFMPSTLPRLPISHFTENISKINPIVHPNEEKI